MHAPKQPATQSPQRVQVERCAKRVRVIFNGKTVADSLATVLLFEAAQMPVYYFPRADVRMDLLDRTTQRTHCPLKGDATYWTSRISTDAVWSYREPLPECPRIKDHYAFFPEMVDALDVEGQASFRTDR